MEVCYATSNLPLCSSVWLGFSRYDDVRTVGGHPGVKGALPSSLANARTVIPYTAQNSAECLRNFAVSAAQLPKIGLKLEVQPLH